MFGHVYRCAAKFAVQEKRGVRYPQQEGSTSLTVSEAGEFANPVHKLKSAKRGVARKQQGRSLPPAKKITVIDSPVRRMCGEPLVLQACWVSKGRQCSVHVRSCVKVCCEVCSSREKGRSLPPARRIKITDSVRSGEFVTPVRKLKSAKRGAAREQQGRSLYPLQERLRSLTVSEREGSLLLPPVKLK